MTRDELIEVLADAEHASWARWMEYLFSRCVRDDRGVLTIPTHLVMHWQRQVDTPYAELSEREKQSDRDEVARILPSIEVYADPYNRLNPFDLRRPHPDGVSPPIDCDGRIID